MPITSALSGREGHEGEGRGEGKEDDVDEVVEVEIWMVAESDHDIW